MMDVVHKIVMFCATPLTVGLVLLLAGIVVAVRRQRKGLSVGRWGVLVSVALAWLWVWSTPMMTRIVGASLEREFLVEGKVPRGEDLPQADAIELHGGSMGFSEEIGSRGAGIAGGDAWDRMSYDPF